jgi:ligand-binding sensor domain-containing protein
MVKNIVAKRSYLLLFILSALLFSACTPDANLLGAGSWQASTLPQQHIHALAVDPVHSQTLYAGNEDGTIYRSSDAGQHWTRQGRTLDTTTSLSFLTITPSGKTLYALADNGLFASNDIAQTWQRVNTSLSGLPVDSYTTLVFNGQKRLYLGTLHHGVFTSSDGIKWKSSNTALPSDVTINELAYDSLQNRLWAATSQGVYRSDNGGAWITLNSGLHVADGVTTIQPAANAGGPVAFVYAGTQHGIFRSTDSGSHWVAAGQLLQGVPVQHILVDFRSANAATLYVGTPFGAFRSDDSGQNWRGIAGGLPEHTSVYALVIGADNASQLFVAVNNVYAYPGTGSGITPTRVITLLLVVLLFVMLFLIAQRSVRGRKKLLKSLNDGTKQPKTS